MTNDFFPPKDVTYSQENLTSELSKLLAEKAESQQKIKDLEDDIKVLTDREKEGNAELERQVSNDYHLRSCHPLKGFSLDGSFGQHLEDV